MLSGVETSYTGDALKTYKSIVSSDTDGGYNTICKTYNKSGIPIFYYVDTEKILHVFLINKHPRRSGYYIVTDNVLSDKNSFKFNGYMKIQSAGIRALIDVLDSLVGTEVSTITDKE